MRIILASVGRVCEKSWISLEKRLFVLFVVFAIVVVVVLVVVVEPRTRITSVTVTHTQLTRTLAHTFERDTDGRRNQGAYGNQGRAQTIAPSLARATMTFTSDGHDQHTQNALLLLPSMFRKSSTYGEPRSTNRLKPFIGFVSLFPPPNKKHIDQFAMIQNQPADQLA